VLFFSTGYPHQALMKAQTILFPHTKHISSERIQNETLMAKQTSVCILFFDTCIV
jgi:hypothetical protein